MLDNFKNLSINRYTPTDYPQHGKHCNKNTFGTDPLVQVKPNKEAENDTTGHRQADLHHYGEVFGPGAVFFEIKKHSPELELDGVRTVI